jgi:acyl-CoA dehydrogenase
MADAPEFSLALSDDHVTLRDWIHDFAERVIRPAAAEWDEREETPWPVLEEAARAGIYTWEFFAELAGDAVGLSMPIANEELFWGDAGIALSILGTGLCVSAIAGQGTADQIATWVPRCYGSVNDIKLGAFCVTEPDAGSDVSSLRTRAVRDGDDWILNGQKVFITNGGIADVHVVVATVDPSLGARGQASFIVPPGTPGLTQGKKERKHGIRASHTAEVLLADVRVPAECVLGGVERLEARLGRARGGERVGRQAAMSTFEATRPIVGAQAVGIARAAYEFARDYTKERRQFGRPLVENQAVAFTLADMAVEIDAARLLVWRASWMAATKQPFTMAEGSMSKLKAGETAVRVTERAIQLLGGYGYIRDLPVERWARDAKIYTIFEGTSEIQRLVIARALSGVHVS